MDVNQYSFADEVSRVLADRAFNSRAPSLRKPLRWKYRVFQEDWAADFAEFNEALRGMGRKYMTPQEAERHFAAFLTVRNVVASRQCTKCQKDFAFLRFWTHAEPETTPPDLCEDCQRSLDEARVRFTQAASTTFTDLAWLYPDLLAKLKKKADEIAVTIAQSSGLSEAQASAELKRAISLAIAAHNTREAKHREIRLWDRIPPTYRETIDRAKLKNPDAFDRAMSWFAGRGTKRGLLLCGKTRLCKTRTMYCGLLGAFLDPDSLKDDFLATSAIDLQARVVRAKSKGSAADQKWLAEARTVDALFIDDISQAKLTPAYSQELYAILEHRTSHRFPVFITSQVRGPEFLQRIAGDDPNLLAQAEAIVGRINDYCDVIDFNRLNEPSTG